MPFGLALRQYVPSYFAKISVYMNMSKECIVVFVNNDQMYPLNAKQLL